MNPEELLKLKSRVFWISFFVMASRITSIIPFQLISIWINDHVSDSVTWYKAIDISYSAGFTIGSFLTGFMCDRLSIKHIVLFGSFVSATLNIIYAVIIRTNTKSLPAFIIIWTLKGFTQSAVWPGIISVCANWISNRKKTGFSMGVFSLNSLLGLVVFFLTLFIIYIFGLFVISLALSSIFMIIIGLLFFVYVVEKPDQNLEINFVESTLVPTDATPTVPEQEKLGISFSDAFKVFGVKYFSVYYAILNMIIFVFANSYYTSHDFLFCTISFYFPLFESGGLIGVFLLGYLSDKYKSRTVFMIVLQALAIPFSFILLLKVSAFSPLYYLIIFIYGFLLKGISNTIGFVVPVDLAYNDRLFPLKTKVSTISGIINGGGAFGAFLTKLCFLRSQSEDNLATAIVVLVLIICALCVLVPYCVKEYRKKAYQLT